MDKEERNLNATIAQRLFGWLDCRFDSSGSLWGRDEEHHICHLDENALFTRSWERISEICTELRKQGWGLYLRDYGLSVEEWKAFFQRSKDGRLETTLAMSRATAPLAVCAAAVCVIEEDIWSIKQ